MLKAIVANLDDVPETAREFYTEGSAESGTEGKYVLTVEPVDGFSLENVAGLKTTFGKEMSRRKELEREIARFKDIDPDKARTALVELEELRKLDPASEADKIANTKFEAAKAQLLAKHEGDISERETRIKVLTGAVDELVREQRATAAIAEAKGAVGLLLPHVLKFTRTVEKDGKFSVEVVDAEGNARIANGKGDPMTIADLVAEMKASETFGRAFDADGHDGTGKKPDTPGGGPKGDFGGSPEERRAAIAKKFGLKA